MGLLLEGVEEGEAWAVTFVSVLYWREREMLPAGLNAVTKAGS